MSDVRQLSDEQLRRMVLLKRLAAQEKLANEFETEAEKDLPSLLRVELHPEEQNYGEGRLGRMRNKEVLKRSLENLPDVASRMVRLGNDAMKINPMTAPFGFALDLIQDFVVGDDDSGDDLETRAAFKGEISSLGQLQMLDSMLGRDPPTKDFPEGKPRFAKLKDGRVVIKKDDGSFKFLGGGAPGLDRGDVDAALPTASVVLPGALLGLATAPASLPAAAGAAAVTDMLAEAGVQGAAATLPGEDDISGLERAARIGGAGLMGLAGEAGGRLVAGTANAARVSSQRNFIRALARESDEQLEAIAKLNNAGKEVVPGTRQAMIEALALEERFPGTLTPAQVIGTTRALGFEKLVQSAHPVRMSQVEDATRKRLFRQLERRFPKAFKEGQRAVERGFRRSLADDKRFMKMYDRAERELQEQARLRYVGPLRDADALVDGQAVMDVRPILEHIDRSLDEISRFSTSSKNFKGIKPRTPQEYEALDALRRGDRRSLTPKEKRRLEQLVAEQRADIPASKRDFGEFLFLTMREEADTPAAEALKGVRNRILNMQDQGRVRPSQYAEIMRDVGPMSRGMQGAQHVDGLAEVGAPLARLLDDQLQTAGHGAPPEVGKLILQAGEGYKHGRAEVKGLARTLLGKMKKDEAMQIAMSPKTFFRADPAHVEHFVRTAERLAPDVVEPYRASMLESVFEISGLAEGKTFSPRVAVTMFNKHGKRLQALYAGDKQALSALRDIEGIARLKNAKAAKEKDLLEGFLGWTGRIADTPVSAASAATDLQWKQFAQLAKEMPADFVDTLSMAGFSMGKKRMHLIFSDREPLIHLANVLKGLEPLPRRRIGSVGGRAIVRKGDTTSKRQKRARESAEALRMWADRQIQSFSDMLE